MKVYAFTDVHGNLKALATVKERVRALKPDLLLFLGDLTIFEQNLRALLSRINLFHLPVLLIHGNHEGEDRFRKACVEFPRLTFLHERVARVNGWSFVGYGGGGFEDLSPRLEELMRSPSWRSLSWERVVFLSHAPPHGTSLDDIGEEGGSWHVGSKTLTRLVKRFGPRLLLSGHIHESFHRSEWLGGTLLENPGPTGKLYDLDLLSREARRRARREARGKERTRKHK